MLVIPAIDLRDGRCVRLRQGRYEDETVYFDDPVRMAKLWRVMNAKVIHLVDLDAARTTADEISHNRDVIARIAAALDVPVQVGGGIRPSTTSRRCSTWASTASCWAPRPSATRTS